MVQFVIVMGVVLLGVYYATIFLHFWGASVYGKRELRPLVALFPFFYWMKKEKKDIEKENEENTK